MKNPGAEPAALIPQAHHRALLDYADAHGIALAAEEFLTPAGRAHLREPDDASFI